ncbi:MAG TPA: hypothetical protein VF698_21115 [Thermoanaerobaculia bacterium]|jgi:hypothetical protein
MNDDRFFERLRDDARPLQAQPDGAMLTRIAARVRERVADSEPSIAALLARWFRPLAATFAALALAASIGIAAFDVEETASDDSVEIQVAGETFHVE